MKTQSTEVKKIKAHGLELFDRLEEKKSRTQAHISRTCRHVQIFKNHSQNRSLNLKKKEYDDDEKDKNIFNKD